MLGWETYQLTSPRQASYCDSFETVDDLPFYRSPLVTGRLKRVPLLSQIADMCLLSKRLSQVIAEVTPDILHVHSPVLNAIPALAQGQWNRIPVVYEVRAFWEDAAVDHGSTTEGSMRYRATRAIETSALKRTEAITCICEGLRNDIIARGIAPEKITVIPNAVDLDKFRFGLTPDPELKSSLGFGASTRVLGFVGSFYAYEGLDLMLSAVPQLLQGCPNIRVLLVGGGPQEENLKSLARRLGIADKVTFAGRVDHREVARYYEVIDILIYARHSMRLTELVTPLKPLEAMAQGQLFIASDVGGHRELVQDGVTGTLFKSGSKEELVRETRALLKNSSRWPAMREAARKFVETERTWSRSVANYEGVYARALAQLASRL